MENVLLFRDGNSFVSQVLCSLLGYDYGTKYRRGDVYLSQRNAGGDSPDVLVCGAGLAGLGAAVAAARSGAKTMNVERMGFSGGFFMAIIGSAFDGFVDDRSGTLVVGGMGF